MPATRRPRRKSPKTLQREADEFNVCCPVGSNVRYWTGIREGEGRLGRTTEPAGVLEGHTAVVWIDPAGFVALSHVEPVGVLD